MEIILSLMFVITPLFTALLTLGAVVGKPTRKRLYKVARVHWVPKFKRKSLAPSIVTSDMVALSPRNKDWGPDGKLTQMWKDAFDYWQIENPQEVMASYRVKADKLKEHRIALETTIELSNKLYQDFLNSRGSVDVNGAVEAKERAATARRRLATVDSDYLRTMTSDERVMERLVKRYGSEVYYNNDMVRLSAQKRMPTFDYIALTSV